MADPSQCWYDWQTVVAGLIAIVAALIGARAIYIQTRKTQELAQAELSRRHNAARSVLPIALSELHSLCQSMADTITEEIEARRDSSFDPGFDGAFLGARATTLPAKHLPNELQCRFQDFVETLDDDREVRHIGQLLSQIQILMARWNSFKLDQIAPDIGLMQLVLNVSTVCFLNDGIFNYARMADTHSFGAVDVKTLDDAWDAIRGKAVELLFHYSRLDELHEKLNNLVDGRKKSGTSPWIEKFEW